MNVIINVGNYESAVNLLNQIKKREHIPFDIRITNTHFVNLNKLVGKTLFKKDSLYINSKTLWEIMQTNIGYGSHNYHGLSPEDVIIALRNITRPSIVFSTKNNRIAIITIKNSHFNQPIMIVIEIGASLRGNVNANVYKIVTMYPKSNSDKYLSKLSKECLLYKK